MGCILGEQHHPFQPRRSSNPASGHPVAHFHKAKSAKSLFPPPFQGSSYTSRWSPGLSTVFTPSTSDKHSSTQNSWQPPRPGAGSPGLIPPIPELTFQRYYTITEIPTVTLEVPIRVWKAPTPQWLVFPPRGAPQLPPPH